MNKPAFRPRPMGGFNPGMGDLNEHLDENAMQAAVQQKALAQQGTTTSQSSSSNQKAAGSQTGIPAQPREVGSLAEELLERPAQDVRQQLVDLFDINRILGISLEQDDPGTQARKKQLHSRWQQLNQEQQQYAQQKYKEEMEKKKQEEQEKQAREQQAKQAEQQQLAVPSSPQKGPVGPGGSKKSRAVQKLQQDRQTLGGPKSSG